MGGEGCFILLTSFFGIGKGAIKSHLMSKSWPSTVAGGVDSHHLANDSSDIHPGKLFKMTMENNNHLTMYLLFKMVNLKFKGPVSSSRLHYGCHPTLS